VSDATTPPERRLVVTADDLGLSPAVNEGVVAAHVGGIVTAASLMVRRPHAPAAADLVRGIGGLSIGLHLELASFEVVDGSWLETSRVVDPADAGSVHAELVRQLDRFAELVGRPPDHVDSHHHLHRDEPVASAVLAEAGRLGIPVRDGGGWTYRGDFYGQYGSGTPWPQGITTASLCTIIRSLEPGVTELACHPATGPDPAHGTYDAERAAELAALTSPDVRRAVDDAGVRLVGSAQLRARD
jgi:predicted glycoside hydrolase/deacetylase ChbG (UPF0249 family)